MIWRICLRSALLWLIASGHSSCALADPNTDMHSAQPTGPKSDDVSPSTDGSSSSPDEALIDGSTLDGSTPDFVLDPGWTCNAAVKNGDLWVTTQYQSATRFQYRIGSGGSIAEIRDRLGLNIVAVSGAYSPTADTDGPIQIATYDYGLKLQSAPQTLGQNLYNKDQGGNTLGVHQPVLSVDVTNASDHCAVVVYTAVVDQFFPQYAAGVSSVDALLTEYLFAGNGWVRMRNVYYTDSLTADPAFISGVTQKGAQTEHPKLYVNDWISLTAPMFGGMALDINSTGQIQTKLLPGFGLQAEDITKSTGYSVFYSTLAPNTADILIAVFGNQPAETIGGTITTSTTVSWMSWSKGLNVAPAVTANDLPLGSMIEKVTFLAPGYGLASWASSSAGLVATLLGSTPTMKVYLPAAMLSAEMQDIKTKLMQTAMNAGSGLRSTHLGPIVTFY